MSEKTKTAANAATNVAVTTDANANTAVAVRPSGSYLAPIDDEFMKVMKEGLAGFETSFDVVRLGNKATQFVLPRATSPVMSFECVILYQHPTRTYYKEKYVKGSHALPDCCSYDNKKGVGSPGGACATCPLNRYGTGENGKSKACKLRRRIYLMLPDELFPSIMSLPTLSLDGFMKYLETQFRKHLRPHEYVTRFEMHANIGEDFSRVIAVESRLVTPQERAFVEPLAMQTLVYADANNNMAFDAENACGDSPFVDSETGEVIG